MSAYLCNHIECDIPEDKRLKVTKKNLSDGTEYVFVGLKLESFKKYLPNVNVDDSANLEDKHFTFNLKEMFKGKEDALNEDFLKWKNSFKCEKKKDDKKEIVHGVSNKNPTSLLSIIGEILRYPLYDSTPNDNILFINNLQNKIHNLLV